MSLDLQGCQNYIALKYHMEDAYLENKLDIKNISDCPTVAIFSRKYYKEIRRKYSSLLVKIS